MSGLPPETTQNTEHKGHTYSYKLGIKISDSAGNRTRAAGFLFYGDHFKSNAHEFFYEQLYLFELICSQSVNTVSLILND